MGCVMHTREPRCATALHHDSASGRAKHGARGPSMAMLQPLPADSRKTTAQAYLLGAAALSLPLRGTSPPPCGSFSEAADPLVGLEVVPSRVCCCSPRGDPHLGHPATRRFTENTLRCLRLTRWPGKGKTRSVTAPTPRVLRKMDRPFQSHLGRGNVAPSWPLPPGGTLAH